MQQALDDLKAIPGVVGAAIYQAQQGVLANNLPGLFKPEKLAGMGKLLNKIFSAGRLSFNDLAETSLCYEEATLITREISEGRYIMVICDPAANMNLLSMSLKMALEDLRQPRSAAPAQSAVTPPPTAGQVVDRQSPEVKPEELMAKGPLSTPMKGMLQQLANVIGPMAEILFQDALIEWSKTFQVSITNLPHLVDLVCRDIGDNQKAKQYRDLIQSQLKLAAGQG
ncbi:hypothetical protein C2E25_05620 [Geothermobacter hydrogeniphilus]|uniref:DUF8082 domain-containing protein n=1 Tax=Geothermobacter hydrogeniphilus TaxID=1969733 RepID=A0A2K2HBU3_9BACT|nr:hypothetical protein [Geothermobacter hydrogeniphilus]PNU20699.1 hypothetical protein C2E25_05620 [Geothermobacter hydrogeniphilus]